MLRHGIQWTVSYYTRQISNSFSSNNSSRSSNNNNSNNNSIVIQVSTIQLGIRLKNPQEITGMEYSMAKGM